VKTMPANYGMSARFEDTTTPAGVIGVTDATLNQGGTLIEDGSDLMSVPKTICVKPEKGTLSVTAKDPENNLKLFQLSLTNPSAIDEKKFVLEEGTPCAGNTPKRWWFFKAPAVTTHGATISYGELTTTTFEVSFEAYAVVDADSRPADNSSAWSDIPKAATVTP
jgi:hypothetical protein